MYDIFFVGPKNKNFNNLKEKFLTIKHANNLVDAQKKSITKFLWIIWFDCNVVDDFPFDTVPDEYSLNVPHTYKNGKFSDGICLIPKNQEFHIKEIENRFFVNKKEFDIVASTPCSFDYFEVDSYEEYLRALDESKTEMFWVSSKKIMINEEILSFYFPTYDRYNRNENHVFLHDINGELLFDGLFLLSKNKPISKREIEFRHLVSRKEWDIVASKAKPYDHFFVETYEEYLRALDESKTEMFWANSHNIDTSNFKFDIFFNYRTNEFLYDRNENHAFVHFVEGKSYYNGLFLLSKNKPISKREIEFRHLVSRKEWDTVASTPVSYEKFVIDTFKQYEHAIKTSKTEMFYALSDQIRVDPSFKFNFYFTHEDLYNRNENHSFKNLCNNKEKDNGIFLLSKKKLVTKKEIEHRHIVSKKIWNTIASYHKPYDIVFISYYEPNADDNFEKLKKNFKEIKRVDKVKGIHQAHIIAAKECTSEMFWVVDGDAVLTENFDFDYFVEKWDRDTVHVWRSKNPINDLIYGYGGVKLLPRIMTIEMDVTKPDMTTSISNKFKAMNEISNLTVFDTDPFNTWKSAFRECCKLSSKIIDRQKDIETIERLKVWTTVGADKKFGKFAISGAKAGVQYGEENKNNINELYKINDFDWLKAKFDEYN